VQIGSFNYRIERAIHDSVRDIDLTRFVRTHGLDRNWPLARARRLRIRMLSVYNPRYRNAWLNRDIAFERGGAWNVALHIVMSTYRITW